MMIGFFYSMKKLAIQGIVGAFHQEAAQNHFRETIEVDPHDTFIGLVDAVSNGTTQQGIIAIENTLAGSIHRNYDLLFEGRVHIIGEEVLRISQHLGALPGTTLEKVKEIHSHYMALEQCRDFLNMHPQIKKVESIDTALSIKQVSENKTNHIAAIGSQTAMELYGLETIAEAIESNKQNYTRFFIIETGDLSEQAFGNKASIRVVLNHKAGTLAKVLVELDKISGNLSKLESMVIPGKPWVYAFYMDIEFPQDISYHRLQEWLGNHVDEHQILGIYQNRKDESIQ